MQRNGFLFAWLLLSVQCFGQQYPFVYYTPKDGLVNSRVRSIKQDSKGRMYFLTYGGLSVYDGRKFTNYTTQEGLANDVVNDILELAPDSFLIAANTSKLNTLVHGKINVLITADGYCPTINRFHRSADGRLYAAADEGLFILENSRFVKLPMIANGTDVGHFLEKVIEYKDFLLLVPWSKEIKEKLIVYNKKEQKVTDVFSKQKIYTISTDRQNRMWVGLDTDIRLLDSFLIEKGKIGLAGLPPGFKKILNRNHSNFYFDSENNSWFFGGDHIQKVSADYQSQTYSAAHGLKPGNHSFLFRDREGIVWISSEGNGIVKLRSSNIQLFDKTFSGIPINISTLRNHNDTLWLFNEINNSVIRIFKNEITSFPLRQNDSKWFDIYVTGQSIYLASSQKLIAIENKNSAAAWLNPVTVIHNPGISVGVGITDQYGAFILHTRKQGGNFLSVVKKGKIIHEHPIPYITDQLAIDNKNQLWLATRDHKLLVFKLNIQTPDNYLELIHDYSKEILSIGPRSIAVDKNNTVWIGTRYNGLYRLEFSNGKKISLVQYSTKNGLTDNFIYYLTCDSDNNLWVGTQSGIDKIFYKNGEYVIANISKTNNLFRTFFRIAVTGDQTAWACANGGILKVVPARHPLNIPQPVLLTKLRVNDSDWHNSANRFNYFQNNISFSVAAPSFIDEKLIRYSYQLAGTGPAKWSEPSNDADFNFLNISPGKYVLKVKADFPEAIYPAQTASYSFEILPPWWQTWGFRALAALSIIGLLFVGIRLYYRRKLEKQMAISEKKQAVEIERKRIATDMHDDLGAGLSRIKFLSETIGIKKQQQQPIEEDINKIREYSHEMINKMGEIVWALNEKNDSLKDLLSYTRAYAADYLTQHGIKCEIEMPDEFPDKSVSGEFRRNIFLSVKEALHNIVKHAQSNVVQMSVFSGRQLEIIIRDDGIGFDQKKSRPFSNGLINIQRRMRDIGGSNEILHGHGTTIKLVAPL